MSGTLIKPDAGDTFTVSGQWGNYDGENALAFGAAGRIGDGWYVSGGVGVGLDEGKSGAHAGVHASL